MKYSYRRKQILLLLLKEKQEKRSLGYIARKIGMLYPNIHTLINNMENRDRIIKTTKKSNNGTRIIKMTEKGKQIALEMLEDEQSKDRTI